MKAYKIVTGDDPDQEGSKEMQLTAEKAIDQIKLKTLQEIGKDKNVERVKQVLSDFGYASSKDVKVKDFKLICERIRAII